MKEKYEMTSPKLGIYMLTVFYCILIFKRQFSTERKIKNINRYIGLITVFYNSVKRIGINSRLVNTTHTHTHESRPKIA